MNLTPLFRVLALFGVLLAARAAETESVLDHFSTYEQGKPLALLVEARQAVFRGTADEAVRAEHERALLKFIASDAHPQAKAIAIEWLGCLGGAASVPGLVAARATPALAAPVAAALERIPGPEARQARLPVPERHPKIRPSAAAVVEFSNALGREPASVAADALILDALCADNELLAGAALHRIRSGAGTPALAEKLITALGEIPAVRQAVLCDAMSTRPDAASVLRPVLLSRAREGDPAALQSLGRILRPDDLSLMMGFVAGGHRELAEAARAGFLRATDSAINPALIKMAGAPDNRQALSAIEILAERNATEAIEPLWNSVDGGDTTRATAALMALARLMPPADLPKLLERLAGAGGTPLTDAYVKATWELVRRHPDPASAADMLDEAAANSVPDVREALTRFAMRIRPKETAAKGLQLDLPEKDDRRDLAPNGHEEIVYMDCGTFAEARNGNVVIRRVTGKSYRFGTLAHPLATVDAGKEIGYEITGLDPLGEYVLGFSAWDADLGKRRQTLWLGGKPWLTDFTPLAWHAGKPTYTRMHLPLPGGISADGKMTLALKSTAGPNAVLSELWLLKRNETAPAKRIVLVTGDDFAGHRWRETGPEFARILRTDPRLEVTVCESPALLGSPALSSHDAVFLHFKNYADRLPTREDLWRNLESYVRGGGGLVIAHFGCGAMQEWNGFVKIAGRVWDPKKRAHDPYGRFTVRMLDTEHPAAKGLKDFTTTDELYTCLGGDTGIKVLAEAASRKDMSVQPMAFVLTPGKGRVFQSPLGHDLGALKSEGVRNMYLRGAQWAAGL